MKKIMAAILCLTLTCALFACDGNRSEKDSPIDKGKSPETTNGLATETLPAEINGQHQLNEFFVTIGTTIKRTDIDNIAKSMGLYVDYKNSGTGIYTYRIATEKNVASTIYREKGSCVTVSFNGLKDDTITEITYFDEDRMVAGYWYPDTGYLLADYNYPQIVYHDVDAGKIYSRTPVSNPKEIIDYSFEGELSENLLETLFTSISSETTKDDLLAFVDSYGLSYNSRGAGNHEVIAYCYEIGDKYGENGSYITFSVDGGNLVSSVTYLYYPANYRNNRSANFYSESYATSYSVPSGFVLEEKGNFTPYSSAKELLTQLYN